MGELRQQAAGSGPQKAKHQKPKTINEKRQAIEAASPRPCIPASLLDEPILMLVVDLKSHPARERWQEVVEQALVGGVNMVQLRTSDDDSEDLLGFATTLRKQTREHHALFVVNRHVEIAAHAEADGVHLPENWGEVEQMRQQYLNHCPLPTAYCPVVGRSVHSVPSAIRAEQEGCDYLIVGTLFPTGSHLGKEPEGLALLREVRAAVPIPLIGIGGITVERVPLCLEAGANGIAVISAIADAPDPAEAARELRRELG